jgi:hypothetical protein
LRDGAAEGNVTWVDNSVLYAKVPDSVEYESIGRQYNLFPSAVPAAEVFVTDRQYVLIKSVCVITAAVSLRNCAVKPVFS